MAPQSLFQIAIVLSTGIAVRPLAGERVEDIGDGEDPGGEGNAVSVEATRIAGAVDLLVVPADDISGVLEPRAGGDDIQAMDDVVFISLNSPSSSLPGFSRIASGIEFADIVQERSLIRLRIADSLSPMASAIRTA